MQNGSEICKDLLTILNEAVDRKVPDGPPRDLIKDKVSTFTKHTGTMWHVLGYVVEMNSSFDIQPLTVINLYERACVATGL
jgi:hypothetical protein